MSTALAQAKPLAYLKLVFTLALFVLTGSLSQTVHADVITIEQQVLDIQNTIEEWRSKYGLLRFKEEQLGVKLDELKEKYIGLVERAETLEEHYGYWEKPNPPREILNEEEFEQLKIGMAAEWRDGHTNIVRKENNGASVGIHTAYVDGKLIIVGFNPDIYVDGNSSAPLQVGDEIVEFNGRPVSEVAKEHKLYVQAAVYGSVQKGAYETILSRPYKFFRRINEGEEVRLKVKRDSQLVEARFNWVEHREYNVQKQVYPFYLPPDESEEEEAGMTFGRRSQVRSYFREGLKNSLPDAQFTDVGALINLDIELDIEKASTPNQNGAASSSTPNLRRIMPVTRLQAYMVRFEGQNVGVIRIPSFMPSDFSFINEYRWLAEAVKRLEATTDVLIIDALSNGGGSVYQALKFTSLFTTEALDTVSMSLRLSKTLTHRLLDEVSIDPEQGRMRPNYAELRLSRKFADQLEQRRRKGEQWTEFMPYMDSQFDHSSSVGATGEVFPSTNAVYTKPILVLADNRSASGGDFFPAFLQQNERALIMGSNTEGLGAPVFFGQNSFGASEMEGRCAYGDCKRPNGKPLENVGTVPNIRREVTVKDIKGGFVPFASHVMGTAKLLAQGHSYEEAQKMARQMIDQWEPSTAEHSLSKEDFAVTLKRVNEQVAEIEDLLNLESYEQLEQSAPELIKTYRKIFNKLRDKEFTRSDWRQILVPVPEVLRTNDAILETLWKKEAVVDRLKQMATLDRFAEYPKTRKLLKSLADMAEGVSGSLSMGLPVQAAWGKDCAILLSSQPQFAPPDP